MSKYLILQKQFGQGCDYTIGCGQTYKFIESDNIDDVFMEILYPEGLHEYCVLGGDQDLEELIAVDLQTGERKNFDLVAYKIKLEKEFQEEVKLEKEERERQEYERLKQKFEVVTSNFE